MKLGVGRQKTCVLELMEHVHIILELMEHVHMCVMVRFPVTIFVLVNMKDKKNISFHVQISD